MYQTPAPMFEWPGWATLDVCVYVHDTGEYRCASVFDATTTDGRVIHRTFDDLCESSDSYIDDRLNALRREDGWTLWRGHEGTAPSDGAHRQWFELTQFAPRAVQADAVEFNRMSEGVGAQDK